MEAPLAKTRRRLVKVLHYLGYIHFDGVSEEIKELIMEKVVDRNDLTLSQNGTKSTKDNRK